MKKRDTVSIRLDEKTLERLDSILTAHPAMHLSGLVRQAVDIGLPALETKYLPPHHLADTKRKQAA